MRSTYYLRAGMCSLSKFHCSSPLGLTICLEFTSHTEFCHTNCFGSPTGLWGLSWRIAWVGGYVDKLF